MKKKFSKHWKASKQKRKQIKYSANIPYHLRKKKVSANLSKELRKKYGRRSIPLRKGDIVKIMRGEFKGKEGKISKVDSRIRKVYIEGIFKTKKDGSKISVPFDSSNLQVKELNLEDKKRLKKFMEKKNVP